jgi:hypothetical protein
MRKISCIRPASHCNQNGQRNIQYCSFAVGEAAIRRSTQTWPILARLYTNGIVDASVSADERSADSAWEVEAESVAVTQRRCRAATALKGDGDPSRATQAHRHLRMTPLRNFQFLML